MKPLDLPTLRFQTASRKSLRTVCALSPFRGQWLSLKWRSQSAKTALMNVLFVCHRFPYPPKRGGKIRPFNIIRHLGEQGHKVHVCSLVRSEEEAREGLGLADHSASIFQAPVTATIQAFRMVARLPLRTPSSMGYFYSPALKAHIEKLRSEIKFDLIFVHCSSVAQYVEDVKGIPKILDYGDIDSQKWLEYVAYKPFPLSIGYWLEGKKLQAAEARLSTKFDLCTATTRGEMETLRKLRPDVNCNWFPNGVDAEHFTPVSTYDPELISFVGRYDYFPNQEAVERFAKQVFPLVRKERPKAKFIIVGAEPPKHIRELSQIDGISVTGTVPDVRALVSNSAVNIANLAIARGTQNKMLEAMAMAVPVIASKAAAGGVDAIVDEHLLTYTDTPSFATKVVELMKNPQRRDELGLAGRNRVLTNHSWVASMKKLDGIIVDAIAAHQSRNPIATQ